MEQEQFDEICSKLNIDESTKKAAIKQYIEISENTILSVRTYSPFISDVILNTQDQS